ncbi:unnamed protein product [Sphagnum troendelagicum]|uniref:Uncharacterized protein n=1 Tax=Sphagnum troendelagicum TaxID=128251 RepID=A0ABP0TCZ5_9BRYO
MIVPNNRYRPPPYPGIKVLVAPSVVTLDLFTFFMFIARSSSGELNVIETIGSAGQPQDGVFVFDVGYQAIAHDV